MDSDSSVGSETHEEGANSDHEHIEGEEEDNLSRDADCPRDVLSLLSAIVVGDVGHDQVAEKRA